jgi:hypothetical protein
MILKRHSFPYNGPQRINPLSSADIDRSGIIQISPLRSGKRAGYVEIRHAPVNLSYISGIS